MGSDTALLFDEGSHTYTVDGRVVPNVTRVLDLLGTYASIPDEVLDWKSEIGKAVHKATELYDQDDLVYESLDPAIVGYVDAWITFREEVVPGILAIEQRVYSPIEHYAGTVDRIVDIYYCGFNRTMPLEIKCTAQTHNVHHLQTAAYALAYKRDPQLAGKHRLSIGGYRACVYLFKNGKYKLEFHGDLEGCAATFFGLLNVYNWLNKEGKL